MPNFEFRFSLFDIRTHPCRCLCFGFTQITRTTLSRRMILHFEQIFLTDERTFIVTSQRTPRPCDSPPHRLASACPHRRAPLLAARRLPENGPSARRFRRAPYLYRKTIRPRVRS
jgi:hypothetical protein